MATQASHASAPKGRERKNKVLGRSAVTGKPVLRPASKQGKLSMREAKTAVKHTLDKKH